MWLEVLLDTKTGKAGEVMISDDEQENYQCPISHPFAFNYGKKCCENKKLLHFGSTKCRGNFIACGTSDQSCLNYNYIKYGCYLENVDLVSEALPYKPASTFDECLDFAKTVEGAVGFIWTRDWAPHPQYCYPKSTDQIRAGQTGLRSWVALFDCI